MEMEIKIFLTIPCKDDDEVSLNPRELIESLLKGGYAGVISCLSDNGFVVTGEPSGTVRIE